MSGNGNQTYGNNYSQSYQQQQPILPQQQAYSARPYQKESGSNVNLSTSHPHQSGVYVQGVAPKPYGSYTSNTGSSLAQPLQQQGAGYARPSSYAPPPLAQPSVTGGGGTNNPSSYMSQSNNNMTGTSSQAPFLGGSFQQPSQGGFNPNPYVANFMSNPASQLGLQMGQQALSSMTQNMEQNIQKYVNPGHVKYYFNVSQTYVASKLSMLIFPYRHQPWARMVNRSDVNGVSVSYQSPRDDVNAPDLYIPVMAYVTYILLTGISLGLKSEFQPQVLGITSTSAFVIVLLQVFYIKLGSYLINVGLEVPFLDLFAYAGYTFIPVLVILFLKLLTSSTWITLAVMLYLLTSFGFFSLRTLKYMVLPEASTTNANTTVNRGSRKRRVSFLFSIAGVQLVCAWLLT